MKYTVKQLADFAGVTPRTLHYYDQIGLLRPAEIGDNGYRYYTADAVLRLQQIMFYRELDFRLADIQAILDDPAFDLLAALHTHKRALQQRHARLGDLIRTIDRTMLHLKGEAIMATGELFQGFDEARQAQYEQEVAARYGDEQLNESRRRWGGYSQAERERIMQEGGSIYRDLAAQIGQDPTSPAVQHNIARWHDHIRHFYTPTPAILAGLAEGYVANPEFNAFFAAIDPALPEFLRAAILHYCAHLPTDV